MGIILNHVNRVSIILPNFTISHPKMNSHQIVGPQTNLQVGALKIRAVITSAN